jgi:hypothetical protein
VVRAEMELAARVAALAVPHLRALQAAVLQIKQ